MGRRDWKHKTERVSKTINQIVSDGKVYIRTKLGNNTLVFSDSSLDDTKLRKDISRIYSGGPIDEYETDAITFQDELTYYALQKYRMFPIFSSPIVGEDSSTVPPSEKRPLSGSKYWILAQGSGAHSDKILQSEEILKQIEGLPDELADEAIHQIKEVSDANAKSMRLVRQFSEQYEKDIEPIHNEIEILRQKISKNTTKIKGMIQKQDSDVGLFSFDRLTGKALRLSKTDFLKKRDLQIATLLQKIEGQLDTYKNEQFIIRTLRSEQRFSNKISKRKMFIFATQSMFVQRDLARDVPSKLLKTAMERLKSRKDRLVAYEHSVIKDGKLVHKNAATYYDSGHVTRFYMPPPILSFHKGLSGSTMSRMSLLVALEVEFNKHDAVGHKPSPSPPKITPNHHEPFEERKVEPFRWYKPLKSENITRDDHEPLRKKALPEKKEPLEEKKKPTEFRDVERGLTWYIDSHDIICGSSFKEVREALKPGFTIPSLGQLRDLKALLASDALGERKKRVEFLLEPDVKLWTDSVKRISRKRLMFELESGSKKYHRETKIGCLVGVRRQ
uniref:Uncharacterized protein n=1 Tax=Candidatus Kentrum sp. TUN TaxID=2126343 RepID=A0A450ZRG0_9GAMM|nr:MAG: hypothetical protein BECKTUN1418F_GA0071002_10852 [Candidatus Kentron sp. TUN]VFK62592.1 MAG: hypothetical protein BECKTUN1418E_GA0071001_10832 [Candidatus Kentron sp. TUN]